jgi:hypothetical protein
MVATDMNENIFLLLVYVVAILATVAAIGGLVELWRWIWPREPLPPPDDPRLRNVQGLMEWRAKRAASKNRWNQ